MHAKEIKITLSDKILAATFLRLIPKSVTPNQLTIFRFFSVPFVLFLLSIQEYEWAVILFIISAFTDALDGALARTTNRITEWGKMYDPMADKLLIVLTSLILIPKYLGFWLVFSITFIEMVLIGSAYYLKNKGAIEIRANAWGKGKMISQSVAVSLLLLYALVHAPFLLIGAQYVFYLAIIFALVSLITYGI